MAYSLFLDDERTPSQVTWVSLPNVAWLTAKSYNEFVHIVSNLGLPEFLTFDHDLADVHYGHGLNEDEIPYDSYTEKTGYDCAKWLVEYCMEHDLDFPNFEVHTMNPVGKRNIIWYIESYMRHRGQ